MKLRTVIVLLIALAVLAGVAILITRPSARPAPVGEPALAGLDVNQVARMVVSSASGSCTLRKQDGRWVVSERFGYPADFERLAERLRVFADLKSGQVIRGGEGRPEEFGLDPDHAVHVTLAAADGRELARVAVGGTRKAAPDSLYAGYPMGQYVRVADGPVQAAATTLPLFPSSPDEWIERELWSVPPAEIASVAVTSTQGAYTVRVTAPGAFEMDGLKKDEEVDGEAARRLTEGLQSLWAVSVADPAVPDAERGLDRPEVCVAAASDGRVYTVRLGSEAPGGGRFARLAADFVQPAPPAAEAEGEMAAYREGVERSRKRAADDHARVVDWVYVLDGERTDALTAARDRVVRAKQADNAEDDPRQP